MALARSVRPNVPPGMEMLHVLNRGRKFSYNWYKGSVLLITFLCYMGFHAARKPPSVVKSVLRGDTKLVTAAKLAAQGRQLLSLGGDGAHERHLLAAGGGTAAVAAAAAKATPAALDAAGWAPFNGPDGQSMLGQVDLAFLASYAIGMFFAGHLGDRLDLRYFLSAGMLTSGVFTILFGMGYLWGSHSLSYYITVSVLAGLCQSTGWPSVVSIVANWFGKGKRGLIMGIWNAHTSVGNILGTVVAAACLSWGWGWSFILPGLLMVALSALTFGFIVIQPSDVLLASPYEIVEQDDKHEERLGGNGGGSTSGGNGSGGEHSVRFIDAWRIPGVSSYAFCLFFSKLIAYTFLYWLPYYIKATPIEGAFLSAKEAGDLSVLFDVGGVAGGVVAGHLSDKLGASALVATSFTLSSVPFLYLYRVYGHTSFLVNVALMMLTGFFVNGPYALITTAVSADLGTHESLQGNAKALATVSAIIDGMGSIGAAIGPMMTGYISQHGGFDRVFTMLYAAAITAGLLLFRLAAKDLQMLTERKPNGHKPI